MSPLIEQLHDIEGLDPIGLWPLAIGWWAVIVIGVGAFIVLTYALIRWIAFKRSWKNDTLRKLALLEKNLSESTARETAIILSEYLRRIALRRFSRKECASLVGESWLLWLTKNDPKQFDWKAKGMFLMNVPYAPENTAIPAEQVKDLIQAVKHWVH